MATTPSGFRYPTLTDDPDVPRDVLNLATDVDNYLHASGSAPFNVLPAFSINGNSATSTKLATARTISLAGSLTGSASFDGSANATITTGNLNGNSATATKLATTRTISLGGSLSGSATFDGTSDITINASIGGATGIAPVGSLMSFAGASEPSGWKFCHGQELLIADFTALYNVLTATGTVFPYGANTNGSGVSGSTHFCVPDLRGRVPMGAGTGKTVDGTTNLTARSLGKYSDAETVALSKAEMPLHNHSVTVATGGGHSHIEIGPESNTYTTNYASGGINNYLQTGWVERGTGGSGNHDHTASSGNEGSGTAHNNMQPSTVLNFIIKY